MLGVHIFAWHSRRCPHKTKGRAYMRCGCPLWVDGLLEGKRRLKSLKTRDQQEALIKVTALRGIGGGPKAKCVSDAIKAWDEHNVSKYVQINTLTVYRRLMRNFGGWCVAQGHDILFTITPENLDEFRKTRAHIASLTSVKEIQILRAFFGFCQEREWHKGNPAKQVKAPKEVSSEKVPYTPMEMTAILSACDLLPREYERLRARALILLLANTGLRVGDVVLLRKERISNGQIFLHTQKTGTPVILPLSKETLDALDVLPPPKRTGLDCPFYFHNGGLVPTLKGRVDRVLRTVFKKSGVQGAHCHRFRHTLASDLCAAGGTTDDVAIALGISPQVAKKHYIKFTVQRQQKVKEVMWAMIKMREGG